eukprot:GGOE01041684.1.p1 GENE.GGOE01041684.1~~GGOE01041684.1.p1  ORF type:complete len:341 (+),score=49.48 GGOE01041684.1:145-1167(+)
MRRAPSHRFLLCFFLWLVCLATGSPGSLTVFHLPQLLVGLCNQLNGLFGYIVAVHKLGSQGNGSVALTIPLLTTSFPDRYHQMVAAPFSSIFHQAALVDAMRSLSITLLPPEAVPHAAHIRRFRWVAAWQAWRTFEREHRRAPVGRHTPVFATFNRAMVPVPRLQRCIRLATAMMGDSFGCLHARIEQDMKRESPEGIPPPSLEAIVGHMQAHPPLMQARRIFVAVGTKISHRESHLMQMPLPWGALLIQRADLLPVTHCTSGFSYLEKALVDLSICRNASWLVGYSGSTFSLKLAQYRHADKGDGWYSACEWGITKRYDGGLQPNQCVPHRDEPSGQSH